MTREFKKLSQTRYQRKYQIAVCLNIAIRVQSDDIGGWVSQERHQRRLFD